ncbi:hypothetical protein [Vreelandella nigrificans]|uniref:Uncharacterized protein n=1 Tax=Vreelandella nigrificans TaxID=2042704 RepID=A0A2A4HJ34_9GAMM|nr:hypothetical protein [Halomonas nigrificans]PCF94111.1 hypothetical protein CPA45_19235 [Halomonas nigrificans]
MKLRAFSSFKIVLPLAFGLFFVAPEFVFWGAVIAFGIWYLKNRPTVAPAAPWKHQKIEAVNHSGGAGGHRGLIIAMGDDHFSHDKRNKMSFFITLRNETSGKETTFWGVDLRRVAREQELSTGDLVQLEHMGQQPVTINKEIRDQSGHVIGTRPIRTHRNEWRANVFSRCYS